LDAAGAKCVQQQQDAAAVQAATHEQLVLQRSACKAEEATAAAAAEAQQADADPELEVAVSTLIAAQLQLLTL
jgi:hypothetical protein